MIDLSRHRFDELAEDDECVLYRPRSEGNGSEVLVLAPAMQYPAPDVLKRLEHEYSLREELDREWAVRPLALSRREGQAMLVLEDPSSAATSLDCFLRPAGTNEGGSDAGGQPMELGRFLRLAVNLAAGLGKLHRRGLMHEVFLKVLDSWPCHIPIADTTCWLLLICLVRSK